MMGNYSSALIPDTEDFQSIVSIAEKKLREETPDAADGSQSERPTLVTLTVEEGRDTHTCEEMSSGRQSSDGASLNGSALPEAGAKSESLQSFSSLLPQALSAALHPALRPRPDAEPRPGSSQGEHSAANMEQLQRELRELRERFDQMKSQHNKEIKLLMNELDEEKRIRLTLQMEIQRMKKQISKTS